jgi:arabinan endo-1,5-alpha-L-arabinosidase
MGAARFVLLSSVGILVVTSGCSKRPDNVGGLPPDAAAKSVAAAVQDSAGATYTNPVIDDDFADPAVLRAKDGSLWIYATQVATGDRRINIQVTRTRDLVHYAPVTDALPTKPAWATTTQNFWAPHVVENGPDDFLLYYAADPDAKTGMCIGVARAKTANGPFKDIGAPLVCGKGFTTIDAFVLDDPQTKKRFLYWGSNSAPIVARELTADGVKFAPGSKVAEVFRPDPALPYEKLIEGPWIFVKDGKYVLFYSGDNCCGKNANYAVLVARADSALGPFTRRDKEHGGPVLLEKSETWLAPGHNAIAIDDRGQDWIVYHAIDPKRPSQPCLTQRPPGDKCGADGELPTRRPLLIDRLTWKDGWPTVEGRVPSAAPRPAPAAGGVTQ